MLYNRLFLIIAPLNCYRGRHEGECFIRGGSSNEQSQVVSEEKDAQESNVR